MNDINDFPLRPQYLTDPAVRQFELEQELRESYFNRLTAEFKRMLEDNNRKVLKQIRKIIKEVNNDSKS